MSGDEKTSIDEPAVDESQESRKESPSPLVGESITSLLKSIKPYRELLALIVIVAGAVSAAISGTIAYFASHTEVTNLECRMFDYVEKTAVPLRNELRLVRAKINRKAAEYLMDKDPMSNKQIILQLMNEADEIEKNLDTIANEAEKKFLATTAKCDRGPQKIDGAKT